MLYGIYIFSDFTSYQRKFGCIISWKNVKKCYIYIFKRELAILAFKSVHCLKVFYPVTILPSTRYTT